jgi:hypothetical protein
MPDAQTDNRRPHLAPQPASLKPQLVGLLAGELERVVVARPNMLCIQYST